MKKTLLLLSLISFSSGITAQVKVNQNAANSAINTSSAFMDASSSPLWNGTTNQGKGILYPRVDLVNYTAMSHAGPFNASNNPNYFDGLLVFNTTTGVAGIGADSVFPGYYYYRNTTTSANGGHWVSLKGIKGDDGAIGPIGPQGPAASGGFTHYVGEQFGGGVIFHLWKDGLGSEHGLIVALTDQSAATGWSNVTAALVGITAQSSWNGLSNSMAIVAQSGHLNSAAKLCLDLISGGQIDWYLPSFDQLNLLIQNRFNINKILSTISGATLLPFSADYWASTEYDASNAINNNFSAGADADMFDLKNVANRVRAIREF